MLVFHIQAIKLSLINMELWIKAKTLQSWCIRQVILAISYAMKLKDSLMELGLDMDVSGRKYKRKIVSNYRKSYNFGRRFISLMIIA